MTTHNPGGHRREYKIGGQPFEVVEDSVYLGALRTRTILSALVQRKKTEDITSNVLLLDDFDSFFHLGILSKDSKMINNSIKK